MDNEKVTTQSTLKKETHRTLETVLGHTGKLVPQAIDFEVAVLGAILINNDAIGEVVDFLKSNMFYRVQHEKIYEAIYQLFQKSEPIDMLSVTNQLRKNKQLEFVGGPAYIASLTNKVASSANIEFHARIVLEKYILREIIKTCNSTIEDAYDDSNDVLDLLDKAETNLFSIIQSNFKRDSKQLSEVVMKALQELQNMKNSEENFHGVPSGIRAIDEKTGGWQPSDLIILAARPGMGKTSFVLSVARNAAIDHGKPIAFFSLEMSATQIVHRLFSMESGISSEKISQGKLTDEEWIQLSNRIGQLHTANLIIDDTPSLSVFDLRAKCRRLKHQNDIQMVIVDYLQLMQGGDGDKSKGNREQEISYISRSLKALAKDLNVPVIALSQLSREVEKRTNSKRPQLSDLRESGSIEQDADMVLFIYRPEYYQIETFEDGTPTNGLAEILFQKNRHGSPGDVRIRFQSQFTKFCDIEEFSNTNSSFMMPNGNFEPNHNFEEFESKVNYDNPNFNNFDDMPY